MSGAEERVQELELELPPAPAPAGCYTPAVRTGNLLFVSGHGPALPGGGFTQGRVGAELSVEEGVAAARQVGLWHRYFRFKYEV